MENSGWLARVLSIINSKIDTVLSYLYSIKDGIRYLVNRDASTDRALEQVLANQRADRELLLKILNELQPPIPQPFGFRAVLTVDEKGAHMAKAKAGITASITVNDDGTLSLNVSFVDVDGLAITTLTAWPTGVALPTVAFSDAAPGPSSLNFTQSSSPVPSTAVPGAFVGGSIVPATPPSPLPSGWGQGVDAQVSIASGLTNQTAPVTEDAGTVTITADASKPGGFAVQVTAP